MFYLFQLVHVPINLGTPAIEITLRLIFRALGMALLTVPLGTLAVSSLESRDMPQGTALNNMMRQLGGSFGISIINTYLARRMAAHRVDLISHINVYNIQLTNRIESYTYAFQQKGIGYFDAKQKAMQLMELVVVKQSSLLSYLDAYLLIGLFFALALPLLLVVAKRNKKRAIVVLVADH